MPIDNAHFVLIPGAWHGAWVWTPVAKRLRQAGYGALALTMPGLADGDERKGIRLQDAVDRIVHEVRQRDLSQVVLVGHSWGGVPVTGAAHALADRLAGVVYCNALVPEQGRSALDGLPPEVVDPIGDAVAASPDGTWELTFELSQQMLMQDRDEETQRLLWELLVPQPGAYGDDPTLVPSVTGLGVPVSYLLSEKDQGLGRPDAGTVFPARVGVKPVMIPGTHESLLTHPDEVAKALIDTVR